MTQREPTLAEAMYGHLTKQSDEAKAKEETKAKLRKFAADLRELNARLGEGKR